MKVTTGKENTMKLPPRHAIHDAVSNIEDLLRVIRRAVSDQETITTEFTTESRAQAFMGLENNLVAALLVFRTQIDRPSQRYFDPTPPNESPAPAEWITHDGSAKRPKDVGKRDKVIVEVDGPFGVSCTNRLACAVPWSIVTRYRIIERAPIKEKRRKVWVVHDNGLGISYDEEYRAKERRDASGGTLYTAKLKKVTE